ncbi:MAG: N-acyl homoserine lactonase family protein [Hyphomonadaceae bacterium]|nr:N-acyl homoserine lactonase family protein [Hyphomonadaceae bacterium]
MKRLLTVAALAALAACSPTAEAPPPAPAAPAVKIYAMDCGRIAFKDVDAFADDGSMKGVAMTLVDPCYLIRHPAGDLLWDTGLPESLADLPNGFTPPDDPSVTVSVPKKLTAYLADLGMTPADIEFVSLSHLHFDHTGNGNLFAASTWIVDKDERDAMFTDAARKSQDFAGYSALENAKTTLIEGDRVHDVFGDGSVVIHQAPGHTPGHTVLLVKTAQAGPVLLTGDLYHLPTSREKRLVPRFNVDRAQTLAAMDKVDAMEKSLGAKVVRQHLPEDFALFPAFPAPME